MKIVELRQVPKNRRGVFHKNGVHMEPHEENTAEYLTLYGFSIEAIRPVNTPKVHNPDFLISGTIWEVKSPEGRGKKNIERKFHEASRQASNFVLDARRTSIPTDVLRNKALKEFKKSERIKHMILILRNDLVLDCRK